MIAEDEQHIADVLQLVLEDEGYRVFSARDGAEALRVALREPPDLVISDVMMPGLDGFGLVRELRRAGDRFEHVPIVLVSARPRPDNLPERTLWIGKPFNLEEVVEVVAALLEPPAVLSNGA